MYVCMAYTDSYSRCRGNTPRVLLWVFDLILVCECVSESVCECECVYGWRRREQVAHQRWKQNVGVKWNYLHEYDIYKYVYWYIIYKYIYRIHTICMEFMWCWCEFNLFLRTKNVRLVVVHTPSCWALAIWNRNANIQCVCACLFMCVMLAMLISHDHIRQTTQRKHTRTHTTTTFSGTAGSSRGASCDADAAFPHWPCDETIDTANWQTTEKMEWDRTLEQNGGSARFSGIIRSKMHHTRTPWNTWCTFQWVIQKKFVPL